MAIEFTIEEINAVIVASSDDEEEDGGGGASEPEGFDSCDEEEYAAGRDPFEDGEDAPPPPAKRSRAPRAASPAPSWKTDQDPDTAPRVSRFQPARTPGPHIAAALTPVELFKLFFPQQAVQTLCDNTNRQAARQKAGGKKYKWTDLSPAVFYQYMGLRLFMGLVKLHRVQDYWRQNHMCSLAFPALVMTRERYRTIAWNLHLSDPGEDVRNDRKKGTAEHDPLFRLRPLMDAVKTACKAFYHPHRALAVAERPLGPEDGGRSLKSKQKRRGFKVFVLVDSRNGYTVDFSIYAGPAPSGHGLSYDAVMSLVRPGYLGTGYHVYMGDFFSSPKLFSALLDRKTVACGAYRESRRGCPRSRGNALTAASPRGSVRWLRDGPVVYVKWMDAGEVSACSTIHAAYCGHTAKRRVRRRDGSWKRAPVPCPAPVAEHQEHMAGLDLADRLLRDYSVRHKTARWYRRVFYHFLDIAATNGFLLHRELSAARRAEPPSHRAFVEELAAGLCGRQLLTPPARAPAGHLPVLIDPAAKMKGTAGRRICELCKKTGQRKDTPWRCRACGVSLCLQPDRNCFVAWHDGGNTD